MGAEDIFLALSSFCPPGGRLLKLSIFPSEFGKKRMAEEEALGPEELRSASTKSPQESSDDEELVSHHETESTSKDMEKVRKYQVNRLKYYYAVAEFNRYLQNTNIFTREIELFELLLIFKFCCC